MAVMRSQNAGKVKYDGAVGVLIAPVWKAQPWYPVLLECLLTGVFLLPSTK